MHSASFETPILIIAWRRPEHLKKVIMSLQSIQPKYVYVAVDGPRVGVEYAEERKFIENTKQVIDDYIRWDCEIKKLYRDVNLGCAKGVSSAITWFFDHVEQGIIIEDDIIVSKAGFEFFEWGLHKFKNNEKVWMVSAWNPYKTFNISVIQKYFYCWGWATWKRTWEQYSLEIQDLSTKYSSIGRVNNYWKNIFARLEEIDTWDYSLQFWMFKHRAKAVLAPNNYVDNIGFDAMGVHTKDPVPEQFRIPVSDYFKAPIVVGIPNWFSDKWDFETLRFGNLGLRSTMNRLTYYIRCKGSLAKLFILKSISLKQ